MKMAVWLMTLLLTWFYCPLVVASNFRWVGKAFLMPNASGQATRPPAKPERKTAAAAPKPEGTQGGAVACTALLAG